MPSVVDQNDFNRFKKATESELKRLKSQIMDLQARNRNLEREVSNLKKKDEK